MKTVVTKADHHKAQVEPVLASEMDASWPPLPGDYLDLPQGLPRIHWEQVDQRNPTTGDYPKHLTLEPWYRQLEIRALA